MTDRPSRKSPVYGGVALIVALIVVAAVLTYLGSGALNPGSDHVPANQAGDPLGAPP